MCFIPTAAVVNHGAETPATVQLVGGAPEGGCFLLRVQNLKVVFASSTYLKFTWDSVFGASQYRVRVININTNQIQRSMLIPQGAPGTQEATVDGLVPGSIYTLIIIPLCANGQESI